VASAIDREMKTLIEQAYKRAEEIINTHREELNSITDALLEKETLEAADFMKLLASFTEQPNEEGEEKIG
jgi:cell division protease FtsH